MDPLTLAIVSTVGSALIIGIGAFAIKLMLRGFKSWMDSEIRTHLVPNGGGSLADAIKRIESDTKWLKKLHQEDNEHTHSDASKASSERP